MTFEPVQQYERNGFVLGPDLFSAPEVEMLLSPVGVAEANQQ